METYGLWKLCQSKHDNLTVHPVIDVFLFLKWTKLLNKYYSDLRLSFMNVCLLSWTIFLMSTEKFMPDKEIEMICDWKNDLPNCTLGYWIFASIYSCLILWIVIEKTITLINKGEYRESFLI